MKKDDSVYLRHILDAIVSVEKYLQGISRDKFMETELLQDGVVRQLEIIGEAATKLPHDFKKAHSGIPWDEIIGLRHRVVHAYFDVNLEIIWEITQNDLKNLRENIRAILSALSVSSKDPIGT